MSVLDSFFLHDFYLFVMLTVEINLHSYEDYSAFICNITQRSVLTTNLGKLISLMRSPGLIRVVPRF